MNFTVFCLLSVASVVHFLQRVLGDGCVNNWLNLVQTKLETALEQTDLKAIINKLIPIKFVSVSQSIRYKFAYAMPWGCEQNAEPVKSSFEERINRLRQHPK